MRILGSRVSAGTATFFMAGSSITHTLCLIFFSFVVLWLDDGADRCSEVVAATNIRIDV